MQEAKRKYLASIVTPAIAAKKGRWSENWSEEQQVREVGAPYDYHFEASPNDGLLDFEAPIAANESINQFKENKAVVTNEQEVSATPRGNDYTYRYNEGNAIMGFGQYRNKTYHHVYYSEECKGYYQWLKNEVEDPDAVMKQFLKWADKESGQEARPANWTVAPKLNDGDEIFKFGKHKGKRFSQVFVEYKDYIAWAIEKSKGYDPPEGQLERFVQWVEATYHSLLENVPSPDDPTTQQV